MLKGKTVPKQWPAAAMKAPHGNFCDTLWGAQKNSDRQPVQLLKEQRNMTVFRCAEDQLRTGLLETYDGVLNIDKEPCFISVPFGGSLEILVQLQRVLSVTFSLNSPLILKNENI